MTDTAIAAALQPLWDRYRHDPHNEVLRNELAVRYQPLVRAIAVSQRRQMPTSAPWDLDDLVGAGSIGLLQAIQGFDPSRGVQFGTYATPRIRGAMIDAIREYEWAPRAVLQQAKAGEVELRSMHAVDFQTVREEAAAPRHGLMHPAVPAADPDGVSEFWREQLRGCSQRERLMLLLYYREEMTMAAIGRELELSESRVSQLMAQLLDRLRGQQPVPRRHARGPTEEQATMTDQPTPPTAAVEATDLLPESLAQFLAQLDPHVLQQRIARHEQEIAACRRLLALLDDSPPPDPDDSESAPTTIRGRLRALLLSKGPLPRRDINAALPGVPRNSISNCLSNSPDFFREHGAWSVRP